MNENHNLLRKAFAIKYGHIGLRRFPSTPDGSYEYSVRRYV